MSAEPVELWLREAVAALPPDDAARLVDADHMLQRARALLDSAALAAVPWLDLGLGRHAQLARTP